MRLNIYIFNREEVIEMKKTSNFLVFYAAKKSKKSSSGPTFGSISKEK